MRIDNPVESLASAVYSATNNSKILPNIEYSVTSSVKNPTIPTLTKIRRPGVNELEIYHFPQTWGSTALGFGGIGGAAMTTAYTTVIVLDRDGAVFFDGMHAYTIYDFNADFFIDVRRFSMVSVNEKSKYISQTSK